MSDTETAPPAEAATSVEVPPERHRARRVPIRTRPVRTIVVALIITAVAVSVPLLVVKATRTIANSKAGTTLTVQGPVTVSLPNTPAALLVGVAPDHTVAGLTILALDGSGKGGTLVVVPAGTEVPGTEGAPATRLADAYADGGLAAERQAVEGVLGITTASSTEADEAQLAALLQPYAPFDVKLDDRALGTGPDGQPVVLRPAGPAQLTAEDAAHLLFARGPNESEVERLPRVAAIWTAILAAAARDSSTAPAPSTPWAAQLRAVAGGGSAVRVLAVRPVLDAVANPQGLDLLELDSASTKLLLAQTMPGAISPANDNIRLRVVNATGDPNLLAAAVARLAYVGANVIIVSDQPDEAATTEIDYRDESVHAEAQDYVPVVGATNVRVSNERIDGIDATIVLGRDFAAFVATEQAKAATSTTAANPTTTGP